MTNKLELSNGDCIGIIDGKLIHQTKLDNITFHVTLIRGFDDVIIDYYIKQTKHEY